MLAWFKRWLRKRYLRDGLVSEADFTHVLGRLPACNGLDSEAPHRLRAAYPAVYEQLVQFYRQDPAARPGQIRSVRPD
jgi:Mlc titration factor MtfA (ptsG expression regulator)